MDDLSSLCLSVGMNSTANDVFSFASPSRSGDDFSDMDISPIQPVHVPSPATRRQSPRLAAKRKATTQPPIRRALLPKRLASGSKAARTSLSKRKRTVFKKAHELWQITGAEVLVVVKVKRKNTNSKTYYGGSKSLVEEFETVGISRGNSSCELFRKFETDDGDNDDEEDLLLGPLSPNVPMFMQSSLPTLPRALQMTSPSASPRAGNDINDQAKQTAPDSDSGPVHQVSSTPKATQKPQKATSSSSTASLPKLSKPAKKGNTSTTTSSSARKGKKHATKCTEAASTSSNDIAPDFTKGKWVAVAYHKTFYIGQIIEKSMSGDKNRYKIKFTKEQCGKFVWPARDEIEEVSEIYIFNSKDVDMAIDQGRVLRYTCCNLSDIRREYSHFKKLHADIL